MSKYEDIEPSHGHLFLALGIVLVSCLAASGLNLASVASPPKAVSTSKHISVDQSAQDASFLEMKKQLLLAIKARDKKFIENLLSAEVLTGLGSGKGKDAFLEEWQQLEPGSRFWKRMERVLQHGAEYDAEAQEFHAPAISFEDNHSEMPQAIVWNKNASLFSKADAKANLPVSVFGEQLSLTDPAVKEPVKAEWVKVKLKNGKSGYMKSDDLYSAFDEFVMFKKVKGKWQLTWFGYAVY